MNCFHLKIMVLLFSSFSKALLEHSKLFSFSFFVSLIIFNSSSIHGYSISLLQVTEFPLFPPVSSHHGVGPWVLSSSGFWSLGNFFFFFFLISWRLITLQYCSGFCHTLTWISHGFTRVPHPNPLSHLPPHPIPLGLPSAPAPSTCLMHPTWAGDLIHPR